MNVFVTKPELLQSNPWEEGFPRGFADELRSNLKSAYSVVHDPQDAEVIIFMESNFHKSVHCIPVLTREPVLKGFFEKVWAINYEDSPAGFLRGLYSSLEGERFDESIHKSWPALYLPNESVYNVGDEHILETKPTCLFSFAGSVSHPIRRRLVDRFSTHSEKCNVKEVDRWFDHSDEEHASYVRDVLDSRFVLCPRGHACYSHRISEVMALGRVPVIIADGWIPFSIPEQDYFLRVPEVDLENLESILEANKNSAPAMGLHARKIWLKYLSKQNRANAAVDAIQELAGQARAPCSLESYWARWNSAHFKRANKALLWQRGLRKVADLIKRR